MASPLQNLTPQSIIEIALRRRWYLLVPFTVMMLVGIYLSLTLPRVYQAETLILVEPQRVPANYVKSVVSIDINDRISTISQQVMSRSNIEKIIKDHNLFSAPEHADLYLEDKIEKVRKNIGVNVTRSRNGADAFSLSYMGTDAQKTMQIANSLASYFINENLKVREEQATGTSAFLEGELKLKKQELEEIEKKMKSYQTVHMGGLPEQLQTNLRILDRLHEEYNAKQKDLRDMKYQMALFEKQASQFANIGSDLMGDDASLDFNAGVGEVDALKGQLEKLLLRYTENHPDVVELKEMIRKMENKQNEEANATSGKDSDNGKPNSKEGMGGFANLGSVQSQTIKNEIRNLQIEVNALEGKIAKYRKIIEDTPTREQELLSLNRDYENVKKAYDSLLQRQLEAGIAVNLERKQKGEQFRIIDYAKLPEKPISPNLQKLLAAMVILAFGLGGGAVFLLEYFGNSYRDPEEIKNDLNVDVLSVVPPLKGARELAKSKLNNILSMVMVVIAISVFTLFFIVVKLDATRFVDTIKGVI